MSSSTVIDSLCDHLAGENIVVTCFYCDFLDRKEQTGINISGALLKQLIGGRDTPEYINQVLQKELGNLGGRGLRLPDPLKMLTVTLASRERAFICIDALDKSPPDHRLELLESLRGIAHKSPNARIILTGRPHIQRLRDTSPLQKSLP